MLYINTNFSKNNQDNESRRNEMLTYTVEVDDNGTKRWYLNGKRHREEEFNQQIKEKLK